jgi:diaminohydroxyphosphoribosylaminopyrimidine deaminase/5-amino-6-(5-phosphoribosylamino)uracil reductase
VHKWRCEEHGIIIGSKTYFLDTPKLDGRNWNKNSNEKFIISNNEIINEPFIQINYEKKSIIKSVNNFLYKKNIQSVIVEGGLKTLGTFIDSGIWDEARIFKSKTELQNGTKAPSTIGSLLLKKKIDNDQLSIIKNIQ